MRDRYELEVRQGVPSAPGYAGAWDGPVFRITGPSADVHDNTIRFTRFRPADDVDAAVARQVAYFRALGHAFEWQLHADDAPSDLPARLAAAGFNAGAPETVATFDLSGHLPPADLDTVEIVRVGADEDLSPVGAIGRAVYGDAAHADYSSAPWRPSARTTPTRSRSTWPEPTARPSRPAGSASRLARASRACGAARPSKPGEGAGSTAPSSSTALARRGRAGSRA